MTVFLLILGAVAAGVGTRLAVLPFVAAAVFGASDPALAPVAVWTAAIAAGWLLVVPVAPRRIAIPALGAAAVLAAGAAPNGAVVLGLWVLGTAAACESRGRTPQGRRWALAVCLSDLFLVGAIATTGGGGFEGWPASLRGVGVAALLVSAAIRVPLAAGPDDGSVLAGLLVVRVQVVLLVIFAAASAGPAALEATVIVACASFAVAPFARRDAVTDVAQELALVAVAVSSARLGWGPAGWIWGALAAGSLIHHLRLIASWKPLGPFADGLRGAAGIGLPFLPVVIAQLEGAVRVRGAVGASVVVGLMLGLAGRSRLGVAPRRNGSAATSAADLAKGSVVLAAAGLAAVWAPVLSLPRPPAGSAIAWPPLWGAVVVVIGAAGMSILPKSIPAAARRTAPGASIAPRVLLTPLLEQLGKLDHVFEPPGVERAVWGALGVLAASAIAMWLLGLRSGFL